MENLLKKLLVSFMAIVMLLSSSTYAFAAADDPGDTKDKPIISGDIAPSPEDEENYYRNLPEEDQQKISAKIQASNELAKVPQPRAAAAYKISLPGTFTMYQQETDYYCVPACVKSLLKYNTGIVYSQTAIANDLGTTSNGTDNTKIAPYINKKQDFYYARSAYPEYNDMLNHIFSTVTAAKKPVLYSLWNPTSSDWHYGTYGHRLIVNAIYSDKSAVQFGDPLGGMQPDWPYYYVKNANTAYNACRDIIW